MNKEVVMATLNDSQRTFGYGKMSQTTHVAHPRLWAVPFGRFLYSLIFIMSGLTHFSSGTIGYAESQGIPMPGVLVPVTGAMIMVGGLSVLFGYKARFGALLIALFLVPTTLIMHAFWNVSDPMMAQNQMIHFMKNIAMLGGSVLLMFYGAGPVSLDHHRAQKNH